ncbi:esterase family protein [Mucilaginibacter sp. HMF5004]|uniref:alpha/beta hydrolase n=1 Tax=Mucilaginibacter rivuli TaxID=2857527 RepID=UPI001C5D70F2|nr:alpha/beta hydrolase-fold protein [Mucilaginibacter rivuli]MBW4891775.1 esterase family protein [Mucilaginibacter rivuli]
MIRNIKAPVALFAPICALTLFFTITVKAQTQIALKGSVERIRVHGKHLEGNLLGDSADRYVSIYLPPSYHTNKTKHYPVVYFLHGFTDDDAKFYGFAKHWTNLPPIFDKVFTSGEAKEMIIVTPNAYNKFFGCMYSNSITTGDWEDFVAKDLVGYIDAHYRTIAKVESRGLAGHSMGGYGTMRIGERHPDVFSGIYLLSPSSLLAGNTNLSDPKFLADTNFTYDAFKKGSFSLKYMYASAAAWSPNPNKPPLYFDMPVGDKQAEILRKWAANMPLTTLDQYITNLKQLHAIAFDAGNKDADIAASLKVLDAELNKYHIAHSFEIYDGTHTSRIANRIETKVLKFFSDNLVAGK